MLSSLSEIFYPQGIKKLQATFFQKNSQWQPFLIFMFRWIIKCPMSVRACVRPFVTFYKKLRNSFVYEHKFTKLKQKVYVNKVMSFIALGLILKNKMAARAVFRFFFHFSKPSYSGYVILIVFKFSEENDYYKRLLETSVFGGFVRVCVCTGLAV